MWAKFKKTLIVSKVVGTKMQTGEGNVVFKINQILNSKMNKMVGKMRMTVTAK